jgi:anti-anti-sigma factor
MSFSVKHESFPGGVVVDLIGSADVESCEAMEAALTKVVEMKPGVMVLDLSKLEYIPSPGLSVIIRANRSLRADGGRLRLASVPESIKQVLTATKLDIILPIFLTRADACKVEA